MVTITIIEDEKDGVEREPTEQEVFERIAKDINEGNKVYACMNDLRVMEETNTIISSDCRMQAISRLFLENMKIN